jgi:hypothetical protein
VRERPFVALLLAAVLSIVPFFHRLAAQISLHASLGARYSTALVKDSVVVPIDLQPTLAPVVQLNVRDAFPGPWIGDATLDISHAGLDRHESGSSVNTGSVTNVALTLGLRRSLGHGVAARLAFGGLIYSASEPGVFSNGSGGLIPLVTVSGAYAPPLPVAASHGLEVSVQYDLHRFMTPALRSVGFNRPRPVHRFAIALSARVLGR